MMLKSTMGNRNQLVGKRGAMGMFTEFYFRANINEGPVADWLDEQINGGKWFEQPFDDSEFFRDERWNKPFFAGGAVYQESRRAIFRRKATDYAEPYHHQLVLASSYKGGNDYATDLVRWLTPHLEMHDGDFLGYSLYEDSCDDGDNWREHPVLYFHNRDPVDDRWEPKR